MQPLLFPISGDCDQLQWAPNGRLLAGVVNNRQGFILDVQEKMRLPWTFAHNNIFSHEEIYCVAWSSNGHFLALGGRRTVSIVNVSSGALHVTIEIQNSSSYGSVRSIRWSPDDHYLAVEKQEHCYLYSLKKGEIPLRRQWEHGCEPLECNALVGWIKTPNTPPILLYRADATTAFYSIDPSGDQKRCEATSSIRPSLSLHRRKLASVDVQATHVILSSYNHKTNSIQTGKIYQPEKNWLLDHTQREYWTNDTSSLIEWAPDGKFIATCFADFPSRIYLWNTVTGATTQVVQKIDKESRPYSLSWSKDHFLAWGGASFIHVLSLL